jgi:hypothetical protein
MNYLILLKIFKIMILMKEKILDKKIINLLVILNLFMMHNKYLLIILLIGLEETIQR